MARDIKAAVEQLAGLLKKYDLAGKPQRTGERQVAFAITERLDEQLQTELKSLLSGWSSADLVALEDAWEKASG